jgi:hypothetical protein
MAATPSTSPIERAWGQGPGLDGVSYQGKPASCGWVGLGDLVTLYPRVTKHQKTDEQVIQLQKVTQPMRLAHGQRQWLFQTVNMQICRIDPRQYLGSSDP